MKTFIDLTIDQYPYVYATILIKDKINREIFNITINLTNSVLDLKKEIEFIRDDKSLSNIRLVHSGYLLNDFFSLYSQGVKSGSTIYLIQELTCKNGNNSTIDHNTDFLKNAFSSYPKIHVLFLKPLLPCIKIIKICLNMNISSMDTAFTQNTIYLFKGEILDKQQTFKYYNINDNDSLVCIPVDSAQYNSFLVDKWLKRTNDSENFQMYIDSNTKKSCQNENAKKADIRYHRIELNKKRYFRTFNESRIDEIFLPSASKSDGIKLNIDYKRPSQPSTKRLPYIKK